MNAHHRINYIEFSAPDLNAVESFYTSVFGWKFTSYGPDYSAFTDGALDGGFEKGTNRGTDGPLVILFSDDLEKTLAEVRTAGGTIEKEVFEFPGGKRFYFRDPAGNELAVWGTK